MSIAESATSIESEFPAMTARLEEIMSLVLLGASEKEMAAIVGISPHTVHDYMKDLYKRFNVATRAEFFARWMVLNNVQFPLPQKVVWKDSAERAIRETMPRPKSSRPTDLELEILNVFWDKGDQSVREVLDQLQAARKELTRETLDKIMHVMVDKHLLKAVPNTRPNKYQAVAQRNLTQNSIVRDLVSRVFRGSAANLIMRALSMKQSTPEELAEIRRMIDESSRKS